MGAEDSQIITFKWNMSETLAVMYELVAKVDTIQGDVDTTNNSAFIMILITSPPTVRELFVITFRRNIVSIGIGIIHFLPAVGSTC